MIKPPYLNLEFGLFTLTEILKRHKLEIMLVRTFHPVYCIWLARNNARAFLGHNREKPRVVSELARERGGCARIAAGYDASYLYIVCHLLHCSRRLYSARDRGEAASAIAWVIPEAQSPHN